MCVTNVDFFLSFNFIFEFFRIFYRMPCQRRYHSICRTFGKQVYFPNGMWCILPETFPGNFTLQLSLWYLSYSANNYLIEYYDYIIYTKLNILLLLIILNYIRCYHYQYNICCLRR